MERGSNKRPGVWVQPRFDPDQLEYRPATGRTRRDLPSRHDTGPADEPMVEPMDRERFIAATAPGMNLMAELCDEDLLHDEAREREHPTHRMTD